MNRDTSWYDKAVKSLEEDLEEGFITQAQFRQEIRELNAELQYFLQNEEDYLHNEEDEF